MRYEKKKMRNSERNHSKFRILVSRDPAVPQQVWDETTSLLFCAIRRITVHSFSIFRLPHSELCLPLRFYGFFGYGEFLQRGAQVFDQVVGIFDPDTEAYQGIGQAYF